MERSFSVFRLSSILALALALLSAGAVSALPSRIVLGGKAVLMVADAAYLFPQARDRVVAVAAADQGMGVFLGALDSGFSAKPSLDRAAGVETYAALKPDLVILKSSMKKALASGLESLGIKQLYMDLETPEDYFSEIRSLGEVFGDRSRAEALVAFYKESLASVTRRVATIPAASRPRVLVLQAQSQSGGSFEVPPASWMQTILVERAGGIPVWKDANPGAGWAKVGPEQILAWNPDLILVIAYREDSKKAARVLSSDARFAGLAAVKAGRVAGFPQDFYSWDQPDTRWILGLQWVAKRLHPELFTDLSMRAQAETFFSFCYGIDAARFSTLIAPRLAGDYAD